LEEENQETVPTATTEAETEKEQGEAASEGEHAEEGENAELEEVEFSSEDNEMNVPNKEQPVLTPRKSSRLESKRSSCLNDDITSQNPLSPKPSTPNPSHIPSPPPSPIPTSPPPHYTGFDDDQSAVPPPITLDLLLTKFVDFQSQLHVFQDEVRVSLASITDQLTQMESRLGAKLDTVEVQTEFIDEETAP
jgi:hypothetical protein